jgi:hypothetical protein
MADQRGRLYRVRTVGRSINPSRAQLLLLPTTSKNERSALYTVLAPSWFWKPEYREEIPPATVVEYVIG